MLLLLGQLRVPRLSHPWLRHPRGCMIRWPLPRCNSSMLLLLLLEWCLPWLPPTLLCTVWQAGCRGVHVGTHVILLVLLLLLQLVMWGLGLWIGLLPIPWLHLHLPLLLLSLWCLYGVHRVRLPPGLRRWPTGSSCTVIPSMR